MSITLLNRISGAAMSGRFAPIGRQAKRKRPEDTQEIILTVGGVGLLVILAILIPA
jgi:hypothetical protein